jgi:sec-independent protein translocase protein TatC
MEISGHFRELRARILLCLAFFIAFSGLAFYLSPELWKFAMMPLRTAGLVTLANLAPAEGISASLFLAMIFGALVSSPLFLYHAYAFCAPAFPDFQKKVLIGFVCASCALFYTGAAFAFFLAIPTLFGFLASYADFAVKLWSLESYTAFLFRFEILFALVFQLPVAFAFLARTGIAGKDFPLRHVRLVIFLAALFSAIVTPPDLLSLFWMAIPILVLYGIGIVAYRIAWRHQ